MLVKENEAMQQSVVTVAKLTEEEQIRMLCQAREDYEYWERIRNAAHRRELEERDARIAELEALLSENEKAYEKYKQQEEKYKEQEERFAAQNEEMKNLSSLVQDLQKKLMDLGRKTEE